MAPRPANYTYRHWNSTWVIIPTGDGRATGRVYWMGFDPSAEPIVIRDTGYYDDIYVKTTYNNNYQFLQSPGYVVILYEMIHDARIIPIGLPHLTGNIRQWMGDARGRWEGRTLVVETTNFTDKSQVIYGDGFHSQRLRITEQFTPVDADTLQYRFTVEDPETWTKPWTAAIPLKRDRGQHRILEYACHEGNYAMSNILSGARAEERKEQAGKAEDR